jgi:predicted O-methyltransferase YrrM
MSSKLTIQNEVAVWRTLSTETVKRARPISMLREDALAVLEQLAMRSNGPVIELGPYVGGSTIAIAAGCPHKVVTVELGGANPRDDHLTSADIIADLRCNLHDAKLTDRVNIIQGHFRSAAVYAQVERELSGAGAGLLFVDVDPGTELALSLYGPLLRDDAFVVVDDIQSEIAIEKAASVKGFIDRLKAEGIFVEIGVFGWGTWFGRLAGGDARGRLRSQAAPIPCVRESGPCWHLYAGYERLSDDVTGNTSPLLLLEDGRELGPAHCTHADIRAHGGGRFSHWRGYLWFSTSDDSDPRSNGRRYSVRLGGREINLAAGESLRDD